MEIGNKGGAKNADGVNSVIKIQIVWTEKDTKNKEAKLGGIKLKFEGKRLAPRWEEKGNNGEIERRME